MIIEYQGIRPDISKAAFVADNATIVGDVVLEEGVSVWFGAVIRGDSGPIRVGKRSNIQDNCVLHCDEGGQITIGADVTVGHGTIVHGCTIHDGCMIGMGSVILNDAVVKDHCMVGAGSLITGGKELPPHSLILGSPAKKIMTVNEDHLDMIKHGAVEYLHFSEVYRST